MTWSRARVAVGIAVVFVVLAVLVPGSSSYLVIVAVVMAFVVAPAFYLIERRQRP